VFQSIAAGRDGAVYFFFVGGTRRQNSAALGRYSPQSGEVQILADADALASASGMGASISLARGDVIAAGNRIWLWLRHEDAAALFRLDTQDTAGGGPVKLSRPLEHLSMPAGEERLDFRREQYRLAGAPDGSLLLTDAYTGALWRIDPGAREPRVIHTLVGLPSDLTAAAMTDDGAAYLFATESPAIEGIVSSRLEPIEANVGAPALLRIDVQLPGSAKGLTILGREDLRAAGREFPTYALRMNSLVAERTRGTLLGYDSSSGHLLRIRLIPRGS
jgi:hypothetical protein